MSDEISAIHAQTSAIFEKLYDENGQPAELDDTFIQKYFTLVQEHLQLEPDQDETGAKGPHKTDAKLSQQDKDLVDVFISSKNETFAVSKLRSVKTLSGTSQRFGKDRGKGTYVMTNVKGIPNITIKTGNAVVTFIGLPNKVQSETGNGEWVKM